MAIVNLGTNSGKALAGSTLVITTGASVPAGALIIVLVSTSGTLSSTSNGVTATGETFQAGTSEAINTSGHGTLYLRYAFNAAALGSSSSITVTFTATGTTSSATAFYWDQARTAADPYQSGLTAVSTGSTATPTATLTGAAASGSLIVGAVGGNITVPTISTQPGNFAVPPTLVGTSGSTSTTNWWVGGGTEIASGAATYAPTISASGGIAEIIAAFSARPIPVFDEPPGPRRLIYRRPLVTRTVSFEGWLPPPWVEEDPRRSHDIFGALLFRQHHNDPDLVEPFIHPPWLPFVFDDQDIARHQRALPAQSLLAGLDIAQPSLQWVDFAYDEPPGTRREVIRSRSTYPDADTIPTVLAPTIVLEDPGPFPRREVIRARTTDPDLVSPFIHPPWAPYVFDDQDSPRHQRALPTPSRLGGLDIAQPSPQWITFAYDEPPGPRREVIRARTTDPDLIEPQPQWITFSYDEPPGPRRSLIRARTTDPDLVSSFIHGPWQSWDEASQTPESRPSIWRRRHNDPDLVSTLAPIWAPYVFDDQDNPRGRRLLLRARQPDFQDAPSPQWVTFAYDEPPGPRRLLRRANPPDPDLVTTFLHAPWAPYVFDDQDSPRHQRVPPKARRGDPDADTIIPSTIVTEEPVQPSRRIISHDRAPDADVNLPFPWTTFAYDEPPGPRRSLRHATPPDPDLVTTFIHPPWAPYVFDDQDNPRHVRPPPIKARQGDPDLAQPQITASTVVMLEEAAQFARRLVLRARTTDPDLVGTLSPLWRPFIFDDQDNPKPHPRLYRARQIDPDIVAAITAPTITFVFDQDPGPRRSIIRARTTDPDVWYPIIRWVTQTFDEPPGPRREFIRARTTDPDLTLPITPFLAIIEDLPLRARPLLVRPRSFNFEPSQPSAAPHPTIFLEDQITFARRVAWRHPLADPDLVTPLAPPWRPFIFDDQDRSPRRIILRARQGDPDPILHPVTIIIPVDYIEDGLPPRLMLLRSLWRAPFGEVEFILPGPPPVPPTVTRYASLLMTAPQYVLDLAGTLPAGVTLTSIISAIPYTSFDTIGVISAARAFSPTTGLVQAISGEVQAVRVPAIVRFRCLASDSSVVVIDGIWMGDLKFFY